MLIKRWAARVGQVGLVVAMAIGAIGAGVVVLRASRQTNPPIVVSLPTLFPVVSATPRVSSPRIPSPRPSSRPTVVRRPAPVVRPLPKVALPVPAKPDLEPFRRLATWFDTYDYGTVDPAAAARSMRGLGVRAIFIQTGRYSLPGDFKDVSEMTAWIRAAHANALKIIGWYLPGYGNLDRDVRRTTAIATFRTSDGQRFDGLGVDIEDKCEVKGSQCDGIKASSTMDAQGWNAGIVTHMLRVRAAVGSAYAMAGIVPPPLGMAIRPSHWTGFPWHDLPRGYDVLIPMAYWSYRDDCSSVPEHCAYGYTKGNVQQVRSLIGVASFPVHAAGGVADSVTTQEVADFVRGAREAGAIGGSLYDYRTTKSEYWAKLVRLD